MTPRTWHYGVVARYWAEFSAAAPDELGYWRQEIAASGEPVLDVGCGTGRLLVPLLAEGIDIDGADISPDMLRYADAAARRAGRSPRLFAQANHELDLPRTYRTVIACGTFGIGGSRAHDLEMLRRIHRHLGPGGALVMDQQLANEFADVWTRWSPGPDPQPKPWPDAGDRRGTADGDEIELTSRVAAFDKVEARVTREMRARLWRDGVLVSEEFHTLDEGMYLVPEIRLMLAAAGFGDVEVQGAYSGLPATGEDATVVFVARR